jgi:hypothetical protein
MSKIPEKTDSTAFGIVKPFITAIGAIITCAVATAKFWLSAENGGLAFSIVRYLSSRFLPELIFIVIAFSLLILPSKLWSQVFRRLKGVAVSDFHLIKDGLTHRKNIPMPLLLQRILMYSAIVIFLQVIAPATSNWLHSRARLVKWSQRDFKLFMVDSINASISQLRFSEARRDLTTLKAALAKGPKELDSALDDLDRIQRLGTILSKTAAEREGRFGPNKTSYQLFAQSMLLIPDDPTPREAVLSYLEAAVLAERLDGAIKSFCEGKGSSLQLGGHKRLGAILISGELTQSLIGTKAVGRDSAEATSICKVEDLYGSIFTLDAWDPTGMTKLMEELNQRRNGMRSAADQRSESEDGDSLHSN